MRPRLGVALAQRTHGAALVEGGGGCRDAFADPRSKAVLCTSFARLGNKKKVQQWAPAGRADRPPHTMFPASRHVASTHPSWDNPPATAPTPPGQPMLVVGRLVGAGVISVRGAASTTSSTGTRCCASFLTSTNPQRFCRSSSRSSSARAARSGLTVAPHHRVSCGGLRGAGAARSVTSAAAMPRGVKKEHLPTKVCVVCNRPFTWRKKWERCWDEVTTCSKGCNASRRKDKQGGAAAAAGASQYDDDDDAIAADASVDTDIPNDKNESVAAAAAAADAAAAAAAATAAAAAATDAATVAADAADDGSSEGDQHGGNGGETAGGCPVDAHRAQRKVAKMKVKVERCRLTPS